MNDEIVVFARIEVAPDRAVDLANAVRALATATATATATRREAGCVVYVIHTARRQPSVIMIHEIWADDAALELHRATGHIRAFKTAIATFAPVVTVEEYRRTAF